MQLRRQGAQMSASQDISPLGARLGVALVRGQPGSLDRANIRNEAGRQPSDMWKRGPRTLLGLMTVGFPNLFIVTGPGSPSVLANMSVQNEYHIDWIGDCIAYMERHGFATIEPTEEAQDAWTAHVAEVSSKILRRNVKNYMVHVNEDDGTRIFMPYVGGMDQYVRKADEIAARGYEGFRLTRADDKAPRSARSPTASEPGSATGH